jgi:hypothetical protein
MLQGTRKGQEELLSSTRQTIDRGAEWLIKHQNADGSFADCGNELVSTYKAPLAFARAGKIEAGARCLLYIKSHNLNKDGELSSGDGSVKTQYVHNQRNFANYMDGWVAIGAWLLGEYAFADKLCDRLINQQSAHGGIVTGPEKWCGKARYDILTAASCARAFLLVGRRAEALKVADFLASVTLPEHQRTPDAALDMSFDASWNHVAPLEAEESPYYRLDYEHKGQRVFCPAFSCAVLCEIWQVSGKAQYLEAARKYLKAIMSTPEFKDHSLSNGKSGWAAGMLGLASQDRTAIDAALAIMPRMLARQSPSGEFGAAEASHEQAPLAKRLEATAEHTAWAIEYARLLTLGLR